MTKRFCLILVIGMLLGVLSIPATAIYQLPTGKQVDKHSAEELAKKQREEYQIFKFKQEQAQKDRKVIKKKDKIRQQIKDKAIKELTKPNINTPLEQLLTVAAVAVVVIAIVLFAYGMFLRSKQKK